MELHHPSLLTDSHVQMSYYYNITLSVVSFVKGPVNARPPSHNMRPGMPQGHTDIMLGPTTVATHTFADAPDLDLIIVPGGMGNVALEEANNTEMEAFLAARAPHASYILSVCTGSVTLARAGLLSGKRATTNKASWAWVTDPVVVRILPGFRARGGRKMARYGRARGWRREWI